MNFVSNLDLLGVKAKEIPSIVGKGNPAGRVEAEIGCLYMDSETGDMYKAIGKEDNNVLWDVVGGGAGSSSMYDYVETGSHIYKTWREDPTGESEYIETFHIDEDLLNINKKALWYKTSGSGWDYNIPDNEYEMEGLFFPRKNIATITENGGAVQGTFIPTKFKLNGSNCMILEPLNAVLTVWDTVEEEGFSLQFEGKTYDISNGDINEIAFDEFRLIECHAQDWDCGELHIEAFVPVDENSLNYSLRRDYTEAEIAAMARDKARKAARKAKENTEA